MQHRSKAARASSHSWRPNFRGSALALAAFFLGIGFFPVCPALAAESVVDVQAARDKVQSEPQDAKARYELGRALRLSGKPEEAARELLEATSIDPSLYVAYHELSLTKARSEQTDEAIERLTMLKDQRPQDLMLRVALSELLEQNGQTYQAARILVDLVYQNAVPEKYVSRVNARIHYLLSKAKDAHTSAKVSTEESDEETLPPSLPGASLRRNLSASKMKEPKATQGFGHASLLH